MDNNDPDLATVHGLTLAPEPPGLAGYPIPGIDMASGSLRVQRIARSCFATGGRLSDEDRVFLSDYQPLVGAWFDAQPDDATRDHVAKLGGLATYLLAKR